MRQAIALIVLITSLYFSLFESQNLNYQNLNLRQLTTSEHIPDFMKPQGRELTFVWTPENRTCYDNKSNFKYVGRNRMTCENLNNFAVYFDYYNKQYNTTSTEVRFRADPAQNIIRMMSSLCCCAICVAVCALTIKRQKQRQAQDAAANNLAATVVQMQQQQPDGRVMFAGTGAQIGGQPAQVIVVPSQANALAQMRARQGVVAGQPIVGVPVNHGTGPNGQPQVGQPVMIHP